MPDSFETFRDPLLSLYQSAVAEVAKKIDEKTATGARSSRRNGLRRSAMSTLPDIAAAIAQREYNRARHEAASPASAIVSRDLSKLGIAQVCAEWGLRYLKALTFDDKKAIAQLKDEYTAGTCDTAWLTTLEEYQRYFGPDGKRKRIPYIRPASVGPKTIEINANARVALIGDWGTGTGPAIEVLKLIAGDKPDVLVHLGDIYYSGTPTECQARFNGPINLVLRNGSMLPVFTLSGNHDMYCGGVGFYDLIAKLNPPPSTQPASFFCLRSADEKWQLLAMDTGIHDDIPADVADALTFIEDDELAWHCDRVQEFAGRTILLSHHQLFSAFSPIGPSNNRKKRSATNPLLLRAFQRMTASKEVAAWFWGHEHTLSIYKPFAGLERGRCLGHGAVPVSIIDDIYKPLPNLEETPSLIDKTRLAARSGVYNHGYALLAFDGGQCRAEYYQATEQGRDLIYQELFS
jgi:hypothetical protein